MENTAFLVLDMQNDLCHSDGVFNKNGLDNKNALKIVPNIENAISFCKENNIPILATKLSVLENIEKKAVGIGMYKKIRPFIISEGLRIGTWGHDLLEEFTNVDYLVKRWNVSAFYHTELARHLASLRINHLLISGFTTNGIVETTTREAASRNFKVTVLSDLTSSYSDSMHLNSLSNLNNFANVTN